jgi:hypothetical protein
MTFLSRLFGTGPREPLYGHVLVNEGWLTEPQLYDLMRDHEDPGTADAVLIGARAVARGFITPEQADYARIRQKQLRNERITEADLERMTVYAQQHRVRSTKLSREVMLESERLSRAVRGEPVTGVHEIPEELKR